jgi:hypothetical protein
VTIADDLLTREVPRALPVLAFTGATRIPYSGLPSLPGTPGQRRVVRQHRPPVADLALVRQESCGPDDGCVLSVEDEDKKERADEQNSGVTNELA